MFKKSLPSFGNIHLDDCNDGTKGEGGSSRGWYTCPENFAAHTAGLLLLILQLSILLKSATITTTTIIIVIPTVTTFANIIPIICSYSAVEYKPQFHYNTHTYTHRNTKICTHLNECGNLHIYLYLFIIYVYVCK